MATQEDDLLGDIESGIREQQRKKSLRKIKLGRAAILIVALLNAMVLSRGAEPFEQATLRLNIAGGMSVAFFVFFLISMQKVYLSFVLASIFYCLLALYRITMEVLQWWGLVAGGHFNQVHVMILTDIVFSAALLYFLVSGTIHARRLEVEKE